MVSNWVEKPRSGEKKEEMIELKEIKRKKGVERECVMLVGTTGTGKTTILNYYTGAEEPTGSSAQSITTHSILIEDKIHSNSPIWLDNPGWSDTDGKSDASVFKDLLRKLQEEKIYRLKAVLWTVSPQPRMDATLQAQAKFIHEFTVAHEEGKIWSNVIIVAKGKTSQNPEEDCQGARTAAKRLHVHADPICLGWGLADQAVVQETSTAFRREKLRMLLPEEIREELEIALSNLPPSVQVVFANQKCNACGQTGDPRLMEDMCHRNEAKGHTGILEQRFSKTEVGVATVGGLVGITGLGVVAGVTGVGEAMAALPVFLAPGGVMASHRFLNKPKDSPPSCGPVRINDMRYKCCGGLEVGSEGCTSKCDSCDAIWGNGPPCVLIRNPEQGHQSRRTKYEVYLKDHDLVENVLN